MKHTWQVYVTSELKIKLFCFFILSTMVRIFIGMENRYLTIDCTKIRNNLQGRIQRFWKRVALYVSHHGWPAKKILGFRWSKKAKITLETIGFWQNISVSIFRFSPFLSKKSYQFFKIY